MAKITKHIPFGQDTLILETGEIARQATASVVVTFQDTMLLVTVVGKKQANPGVDFTALTVHYQERTYAAGRIPGGYFKREGRPSEFETLTSRLIDRPLRPLFPKGFYNEVQVVATVLSAKPGVNPDIPAVLGASAALAISGIPFAGPIGAARVGYVNDMYVLNPSIEQLKDSALDLVVAGTSDAILMVESEAQELPEHVMLGAVMYGHEMMQSVVKGIKEFAREVATPAWDWQPAVSDDTFAEKFAVLAKSAISDAYRITDKVTRSAKLDELRQQFVAQFTTEGAAENTADDVQAHFSKLEKLIVRERVINGEPRIDGRTARQVRQINVKTGVLPRAHGSALFTRGETQALVVATLGKESDAPYIDGVHLTGEIRDRYMLHYNFPPYCVGETGMMSGPKRREIGHGRLARRATECLLPKAEDFSYVIRVVSEITESNGSSSMATVCGTSLALMDAGVPFKAPVAGIAMGLVKEGDRFAVLSDILGDEDYLGDMDFKVAGTERGITALQMDIKITGITKEIMEQALEQAHEGRLHILGIMGSHIQKPREQISEFAPRITIMRVNTDKIRDIIGKGGVTIRQIIEETGVDIDISDDGVVKIFSAEKERAQAAVAWIERLTEEVQIGKIYEGKISKIVDFGAFVTILPGKDGLLHISQISEERVENVADVLSEGETIRVKVLDVDRQGKIKLSKRALETSEPAPAAEVAPNNDE